MSSQARPTVRVALGARLHAGFLNLSLERERLYGGVGLGLDRPRTVVTARPATEVACAHDRARTYAEQAVERLEVPGAALTVESALPAHVGLGSGTRLALTVLAAVAAANDVDPEPRLRALAPALGRGGRSGVGVATAEAAGFVVDAGHPAAAFTEAAPARGEWTVPPVAVRRSVPEDWRFVVAVPDAPAGRSGAAEDEAMRAAVEAADPAVADRVAGHVTGAVLPGLATGDHALFGRGLAGVGRANGAWYEALQGGTFRPPAGELVAALRETPATGVGQSSWGPAVWAVTDAEDAESVARAARRALATLEADGDAAGGDVHVARPATAGLTVERS